MNANSDGQLPMAVEPAMIVFTLRLAGCRFQIPCGSRYTPERRKLSPVHFVIFLSAQDDARVGRGTGAGILSTIGLQIIRNFLEQNEEVGASVSVFIRIFVWTIAFAFGLSSQQMGEKLTICRIKYSGGGDWYSDPSSLPNLLKFISQNTNVIVDDKEARVSLEDDEIFNYPYLYLTGHGNIRFSEQELIRLRTHLLGGGFLHADDNYGMDKSFRREMKRVFPNKDWVELPFDHPIYHTYYDFPGGLPKIHEHDNQPPQGLGLFDGDRLIVFYTYETDLGDGWEDPEVHNDPVDKREAALKMGLNVFLFALIQ